MGVIALMFTAFQIFMHPILKLITATIPASDLRSKAGQKKQEADSFASKTDAKTAEETRRRDNELIHLKQQRENCQQRIGQMFPVNAANAGSRTQLVGVLWAGNPDRSTSAVIL